MTTRFVGAVSTGWLVAILGACTPRQTTPATQPRPAASPATPATAASPRDTTRPAPGNGAVSAPNADPFPSTYTVPASRATLIRDVTILTTPGSGYEGLLQYGNTVLADRMMFGTSYPMQPIARAVDEVLQLPLKDAVREQWLYGNAAKFLGVCG